MNRKIILAYPILAYAILTTSFHYSQGQTMVGNSIEQSYLSDFQISSTDLTSNNILLKLKVDAKVIRGGTSGTIKILNPDNDNLIYNFYLGYFNTTKDDDGTVYWFAILANRDYNILKIRYWNKPKNANGKRYNTIIVICKKDDYGNLIDDMGFLCKEIKNTVDYKNTWSNRPIEIIGKNEDILTNSTGDQFLIGVIGDTSIFINTEPHPNENKVPHTVCRGKLQRDGTIIDESGGKSSDYMYKNDTLYVRQRGKWNKYYKLY